MNLVWFRSDLRTTDNSALWNALNSGPTLACFLYPDEQWRSYGLGPRKIAFVLQSANILKALLEQIDVELIIERTGNFQNQARVLTEICQKYNVTRVYWNNEYPLDERARDNSVQAKLENMGIECVRSEDSIILKPGDVLSQQGNVYNVFTPFKNRWLAIVEGETLDLTHINDLEIERVKTAPPHSMPLSDLSIKPGEPSALRLLESFSSNAMDAYKNLRDFPETANTSKLSAHLSAGTLSPRSALNAAMQANQGELSSGSEGVRTWVSQIIWREFYYHLIAMIDRLSMNQPFKPETNNVLWNHPGEALERWKNGQTGVPFVDAGMRQLNQEGWMHNRARMVTAMYLTKNLLIDWRQGERYFLEQLIDADFALNNGGWQWSASTGTDAAPYFRVFNPFSQAQRFDPQARYIKTYVPELEHIPPKLLHDEQSLLKSKPDNYPNPMVDTKSSRAAAILAFKDLKQTF